MSDILKYKFYLNFKNEGSFGRIEISEPIGFDGSSFVVEQEAKRYGRDAYKINEEISLNFYKGNFETSSQQQLPNGTVVYNLTQGFDWLIEVYNEYAFEADVDFEIELDGLVFIPSNLDFVNAETDEYSYFTCKAVQEQGRQLIKRRADIVTDLFSTEDLDGNTITPIQTENILLKAKPITQISEWNVPTVQEVQKFSLDPQSWHFNFINGVLGSSIDNTLSFLQGVEETGENFNYIEATKNLDPLTVTGTNIKFQVIASSSFNNVDLCYRLGSDYASATEVVVDSYGNGSQNGLVRTYENISFNLNFNIPIGFRLWVYFKTNSFDLNITVNFISGSIEAKGIATAISTVIKGARYIDVYKENVKRINSYEVEAPRFDEGGQYYDRYAFTGNLIKQRIDLPFSVKFKDITDDLMELNCDYQVIDGKVYIGQYADFYPNKEIAVFLTSPDTTFKRVGNERFAINEFTYKYKIHEQGRDEENTTDAIHTDTQWLTSNKKVENKKPVEINVITDPYKIQATVDLGSKETTSTSDDDKLFAIDTVSLAPNSKGGFSALMNHNIDEDGNVQLLKSADLPSWTLLGFGVGDNFEIITDDNQGTYTVLELDSTVIRLQPVNPSTQSFTGESYTQVEYPYTNVNLTNRTNEGLVFVDNLLNGDDFSNLKYSIKRNIETWKPYLATASIDENGTFKNTYFKDNSLCTTRFDDELENIEEGANIANTDLGTPVLTPYKFETTLVVPFKDMKSLIDLIDTVNSDNTIGGFIRCIDNNERVRKLYPQKLEYLPSNEKLTKTGEERYESDTLTITTTSSTVTINEVGYDLDVLSDPFYEFDGDYFKIYDSNKLPVINPTKYDKIEVNGQSFSSSSDLLGYFVGL